MLLDELLCGADRRLCCVDVKAMQVAETVRRYERNSQKLTNSLKIEYTTQMVTILSLLKINQYNEFCIFVSFSSGRFALNTYNKL